MSSRLGLELGPQTIRAVHLSGFRGSTVRTMETSWDPEKPADAIAAIREHLGSARHVAAAVDLTLLQVKNLELPPLPLEEKRRLLSLEPDRYFAVRGEELVFALREDDGLVFAAREALLSAWIAALETLGSLERIEPGPVAFARALARGDALDAFVVLNDHGRGIELLQLEAGTLRSARRLFADLTEVAGELASQLEKETKPAAIYLAPWDEADSRTISARLPHMALREAPRPAELDPSYLAAYGAALADQAAWRQALLTPELERQHLTRHWARIGIAAAACVAALVFALLSVDAYRARAEARLDARLAELRRQAAPAMELQARLEALDRETRAVAAVEAERPDPLRGLLELSERLPEDTWIRSIRTGEGEVEIDGYARDAAALIPLFENDPRFENVRFRSATARAQIGTETYENFSLALSLVRTP
ncbi:MAG: PilN domain-containing protein [Gemmatimonadota bacterium]|nr:MAG: PilN domain-containing protein [Gemmatimonadota bacterium]